MKRNNKMSDQFRKTLKSILSKENNAVCIPRLLENARVKKIGISDIHIRQIVEKMRKDGEISFEKVKDEKFPKAKNGIILLKENFEESKTVQNKKEIKNLTNYSTDDVEKQFIDVSTFEDHVKKLFVKPKQKIGKILHAAVGISGESGELLDAVKKTWIYGKELDCENIIEECGDLLFYITAILIHTKSGLNDAFEHNYKKLSKRYPNGYSDECALNRADKN